MSIIVFGMGKHMEEILNTYDISQMIEVVIDNNIAGNKSVCGEIISWNEYLQTKDRYKSPIIVIGTYRFFESIKDMILQSGLFSEESILYIDEWIKRSGFSASKRTKRIPCIPNSALEKARVLSNRSDVLKFMPKNIVAAEVGVAFGDFSKQIIDIMNPSQFYAIDIFSENTKGFWWGEDVTKFEDDHMSHLEWYRRKFEKEIEKGVLKTVQGLSWECLEKFPDDFFDYVYLDAAHDYESVKKDVNVLLKKVRKDGIIQFNDYIYWDFILDQEYGVMQVVNELLSERNAEMLYYCLGEWGFDDVVIKLKK